jgi:tRNA-dihydrouridine synthase A
MRNFQLHRFCVAPMMERTDRHCRYFLRLISRRALLYTEMIVAEAIVRNEPSRFLAFDPAEAPVALQLGGSDPATLARAAEQAERFGYAEVNLNCGCPSDRVQSGRFGACLMAEPATVAACVAAMRRATALPVTVKHRLGIDERDDYGFMREFVDRVAEAGSRTFIVHARKAVLSGLSPKENREIPPLRYEAVHRLKAERPELEVVLNGGLKTLAACEAQLAHVDGVMLGREAYDNPYLLAEVDRRLYSDCSTPVRSRAEVVEAMAAYVEAERARGTPPHAITRHMLGLFHGLPGARAWRRQLSARAAPVTVSAANGPTVSHVETCASRGEVAA